MKNHQPRTPEWGSPLSTSTNPNPTPDRPWWPAAENRKGGRGEETALRGRGGGYTTAVTGSHQTAGLKRGTVLYAAAPSYTMREKTCQTSRHRPSAARPCPVPVVALSHDPGVTLGQAVYLPLARSRPWAPSLSSAPCASSPGDPVPRPLPSADRHVLMGAAQRPPGGLPSPFYRKRRLREAE